MAPRKQHSNNQSRCEPVKALRRLNMSPNWTYLFMSACFRCNKGIALVSRGTQAALAHSPTGKCYSHFLHFLRESLACPAYFYWCPGC